MVLAPPAALRSAGATMGLKTCVCHPCGAGTGSDIHPSSQGQLGTDTLTLGHFSLLKHWISFQCVVTWRSHEPFPNCSWKLHPEWAALAFPALWALKLGPLSPWGSVMLLLWHRWGWWGESASWALSSVPALLGAHLHSSDLGWQDEVQKRRKCLIAQ